MRCRGVYASHESIAGEWAIRSLYPGSPYGCEYGGFPGAIPDLTYEEFRRFHRIHYHPSNCRIFLYGNIPTDEQCGFLQDNFLHAFSSGEGEVTVSSPMRWDRPLYIEKTSPIPEGREETGKTTILMNFRTVPVTDPVALLGIEILAEALMGNDGSPVTKAVQESNLGDDLSPVSGLDSALPDVVVSIGIRGSEPDRVKDFEELVFGELRRLADKGIPGDILEGALRRVEFRNREIRGGVPFGLRLLGKSLRGWMNGIHPETTMLFSPWMEEIKRKNAGGGYFEELLRRQFLENSHRSTLVVRPDRKHSEREAEALRTRLEEKIEQGGPGFRDECARRTREFYRAQETEEDPAFTVPSLSKEDLPEDIRRIDTREETRDGIPVYSHDLFTNGVMYVDILFDVSGLDTGSSALLPFFSRLVTSCGLPGMPYDEVARKLTLKTGGLYSFLESNLPVSGGTAPLEYLTFRMKTLGETADEALDLLGDLLTRAVLDDVERIGDLAAEARNDFRGGLLDIGHSLASLRAAGRLSGASAREEQWRGIEQFLFLEGLVSRPEELPGRLEALREKILTRDRVRLHVTGEGTERDTMIDKVIGLSGSLPRGGESVPEPCRIDYERMEGLVVESAVGFASTVLKASRLGTREHAAEVVLSRLLSTGFLWEKVRMRGGAYGVFAGANGIEGLLSMTSYRDPGVDETLRVFREGLETIARGEFSDEDLEKTIISIVGKELRPLSPSEESLIGLRRRLYGITDELRLDKHNTILRMDRRSLRERAEGLLQHYDMGASVVIGGRPLIDPTIERYPGAGKRVITLPV